MALGDALTVRAAGRSVHQCCCKGCATEVMLADDPRCPKCSQGVAALILTLGKVSSSEGSPGSSQSSSAGDHPAAALCQSPTCSAAAMGRHDIKSLHVSHA